MKFPKQLTVHLGKGTAEPPKHRSVQMPLSYFHMIILPYNGTALVPASDYCIGVAGMGPPCSAALVP